MGGEVWSIHGGGFYRVEKFNVAPATLPPTLHWFKWDAYLTLLSGLALLTLVYYIRAEAYLIDPAVAQLTPLAAIAIGVGSMLMAWIVYDGLCKSPLSQTGLLFFIVIFGLVAMAAYGLTQVFSARGAYIHVGAMLGNIMALNVFFTIIPGQKELVRAMVEHRDPDPLPGIKAKQRSLHNSYFTLPVLFIMISNHYPFTFGHAYNWAVLAGLALGAIAVRHYVNRHEKGFNPVWLLPAAAVMLIALTIATKPASLTGKTGEKPVAFSTVQAIIIRRCTSCHSAEPTDDVFRVAPLGAKFDTPQEIKRQILKIKARAIDAKTMPLANKTHMTDEERKRLALWIAQGAAIKD